MRNFFARVSVRCYSIVVFVLLGLGFMAGYGLWQLSAEIRAGRLEQLQAVVDSAAAMVAAEAERVSAGETDEKTAAKIVADTMSNMRFNTSDYVFIIDDRGLMLAHPDPKLRGNDTAYTRKGPDGRAVIQEMVALARKEGAASMTYDWTNTKTGASEPKAAIVRHVDAFGGVTVAATTVVADINAQIRSAAERYSGLAAILTLALTAVVVLIARSISQPIARIQTALMAVGEGDYHFEIDTSAHGELGAMALTLTQLRDSLSSGEEDRAASERLREEMQTQVTNNRLLLADDFEKSIGEMTHRLRRIVRQPARLGPSTVAGRRTRASPTPARWPMRPTSRFATSKPWRRPPRSLPRPSKKSRDRSPSPTRWSVSPRKRSPAPRSTSKPCRTRRPRSVRWWR